MTGPIGPPDGTAPHVLVEDVEVPVLDPDALHHLGRVRRLRRGDPCTVTDGVGRWRWCRFTGAATLQTDGDVVADPAPDPELAVAFALTKGVKPDWTVQKLTELGVDRIVPFRADRSVVRWDDDRAGHHHERMTTIARAAAEQAHRTWLPVVEPVTDVAELAARGARRLDRGGAPLDVSCVLLAVGPEGGWSDVERGLLPSAVGVGAHVLRAETAAVTAGALMTALRAGTVRLPHASEGGG